MALILLNSVIGLLQYPILLIFALFSIKTIPFYEFLLNFPITFFISCLLQILYRLDIETGPVLDIFAHFVSDSLFYICLCIYHRLNLWYPLMIIVIVFTSIWTIISSVQLVLRKWYSDQTVLILHTNVPTSSGDSAHFITKIGETYWEILKTNGSLSAEIESTDDSARQRLQLKRSEQFQSVSAARSIWIPFIRYGIIGLCPKNLPVEKIESIFDGIRAEWHRNESDQYNVSLHSCQEIAMKLAASVCSRRFRLPFNCTNLKITSILLLLYTPALISLIRWNAEVHIAYK